MRKPKKLPAKTARVSYDLEYGTDALEIHLDAIEPGQRVIIVDDLLATGGTSAAAARLISQAGGNLLEAQFLIELAFLSGRAHLDPVPVRAFLRY